MLCVAFLDEFVFGIREAAWPLIRHDLRLSYAQIGIALTVPSLVSNAVEPVLGIVGDTHHRRRIVLMGGILYAISLMALAVAGSLFVLLAALSLLYPASGGFVALSQATLTDETPAHRERAMTLWNLAGSVGVLLGPLAVSGFVLLGHGWRPLFAALSLIAAGLSLFMVRQGFARSSTTGEAIRVRVAARAAINALRRGEVMRWLILLEASDLLLDVLLGYLAVYFVDVAGAAPAVAALAVTLWSSAWLLGSAVMIVLLARFKGLKYVRATAIGELLLFPAMLLVPGIALKMVLIVAIALLNAGWYPVLQSKLYDSLPGQSGSVVAFTNLAGVIASVIPLALGVAAQHLGLGTAVWFLLIGPLALLVGIPSSEFRPTIKCET